MSRDSLFERGAKLLLYCTSPIIFALLAIYEKLFRCNDDTGNYNSRWSPSGSFEESKARHAEKVQRVQAQVKAWNKSGRKGHMCTRRPTWKSATVHNIDKTRFTQIEIDMDDIIEIDTEKRVLTVEPGMTMGRLTSILVPMGWTIPVIPELELLTIGGTICGAGVETSSHKYGLISDTVISHEFVLASGEVINCSETENSDLYHCVSMSHGTLGFLTAVQIPLIPASKYIKVEYYATDSVQGIDDLCQKGYREAEFIEGFIYAKDKAVIMLANFSHGEPEPHKINYINKWWQPFFYAYVEDKYAKYSSTKPGLCVGTEYLPTRDYYHRHSRGIFWQVCTCIPYGNHSWFRHLFGWIYPINFQFLKKITPMRMMDSLMKNHVLQDFAIPVERMEATLQFAHDLVEIYPVWLCPILSLNKPGRGLPLYAPAEMYIDVGIYGNTPKKETYDQVRTTQQMERFVIANKGFQATYADIYMTREEFLEMFVAMKDFYFGNRKKYGAEDAFPDVYDKVSFQARRRRAVDANNVTNEV